MALNQLTLSFFDVENMGQGHATSQNTVCFGVMPCVSDGVPICIGSERAAIAECFFLCPVSIKPPLSIS